MKATMSSLNSIVAPLSVTLEIVPLWIVPTANSTSYLSQGFCVICL